MDQDAFKTFKRPLGKKYCEINNKSIPSKKPKSFSA